MEKRQLINVSGWSKLIGISYHTFKKFIDGTTKHPRFNKEQIEQMDRCIEEGKKLLQGLEQINNSYKQLNNE